jgi:hypothetical protein
LIVSSFEGDSFLSSNVFGLFCFSADGFTTSSLSSSASISAFLLFLFLLFLFLFFYDFDLLSGLETFSLPNSY